MIMSQESILADSLPPYQNPPLLPTDDETLQSTPLIRAEGSRRHRRLHRGPLKLIEIIQEIYHMIVEIHNEIVSY